MGRAIPIPIGTGYYQSSSKPLAAQELVGYFVQVAQTEGALTPDALFDTPGIVQVATMGTGPGRGFDLFDGEFYNVSGGSFFKMDSSFNVTNFGSITGTGRCSLTNNGTTIAIQVPGGDGYFYDAVNGLQLIVDATYQSFQAQDGGVQGVTVKDGFFVYTTKFEFFLSSLVTENGGRNFNGLQFGTAEIKPDPNVRPATIKNELYIIGTDTIEPFQNTGGTDVLTQPFQRILNATLDKGLVGQFAFAEFDNSYVFLGGGIGEGVSVWRGGPGAASKIRTAAIDFLINQSTIAELQDAFAYTYSEEGNFFVGFTNDNFTIEYNSTTSAIKGRPMWHTRQTAGGRWRVNDVADIFGKSVVTDQTDGRIGAMSRTTLTEYGDTIKRVFSGAYLSDRGSPISINELEIRNEAGVGNAAATNPTQLLEISEDGGFNFDSMGSKSLGKSGDRAARQIWTRLGEVPYQAVFRATVEAPVRSVVLEMNAIAEGGND